MRYNRETEQKMGDFRVIKKYLYFPLRLPLKDEVSDMRVWETRWREESEIIQRLGAWNYGDTTKWLNYRWNDNGHERE